MSASARRYVALGSAIALVIVAVVAGLMVLGSPAEERLRRLDEKRLQDQQEISRATNGYWVRNGRLPASLDDLLQEPSVHVQSHDPDTGQTYGYRVVGDNSYELCADFQHQSVEESVNRFWSHDVGRHCFQLEAKRR